MEYRAFLELIQKEIERLSHMPCTICVNRMIKNNNVQKDSMTILYADENVSPSIALDIFYEKYQKGIPVQAIAEEILSLYRQNKKTGKTDIRFYLDFDQVREHLFCKVINYEKNLLMLKEVPYVKFLDLAVVYYCEVENEEFGSGTILVQNAHLRLWQISEEEVQKTALHNTRYSNPYDFMEISELIRRMTGYAVDRSEQEEIPMYVLTNVRKYFGAVHLCFPEVQQAIAQRLGSDYYILPSSIHECMVIPVLSMNTAKAEEYQQMVEEINEGYVADDEVLGTSVYRYSCERKELYIAAQRKEKAVSG